MTKTAIVLNSGGLDSTTCIAWARAEGWRVLSLSIRYGQRHAIELERASANAATYGAEEHRVLDLDLAAIERSELTGTPDMMRKGPIPPTYVPARNIIFLSLAAAWAESTDAEAVVIGVNCVDYSGYPDCRPEFIKAYQRVLLTGTKRGVESNPIEVLTPLIQMSKSEIIAMGLGLGVDYGETVTCYNPSESGAPCGSCDSCQLRTEGFAALGMRDPSL